MTIPRHHNIFAFELVAQLGYIKIAWEGLQQLVHKPDFTLGSDIPRVYFFVQAFFNAQGTASYLLWPTSTNRPNLAGILSLDDSSPLKSKEPRNSLVHVDDRISKQWAKVGKRGSGVHHSLGSLEATVEMGFEPHEIYQLIDTTRMTIVFFGKTYRMRPIADLADHIFDSAKQLCHDIRKGKYE